MGPAAAGMRGPDEPACEVAKDRGGAELAIFRAMPQPCLPGADDGLRAVGDLELVQDVGDVIAHRLRAQAQIGRDL